MLKMSSVLVHVRRGIRELNRIPAPSPLRPGCTRRSPSSAYRAAGKKVLGSDPVVDASFGRVPIGTVRSQTTVGRRAGRVQIVPLDHQGGLCRRQFSADVRR